MVMVSTTNRLAIAPEASPNRGNSLDKIKNRDGSLPDHGSRYFLSTVSKSSPETDSNRSTTWWTCCRPVGHRRPRARGLPSSGDNPKLVPRLASVGPATLPLPSSAARTRAMVPLPDRVGPIRSMIL